jgi:phage terminase large subunit
MFTKTSATRKVNRLTKRIRAVQGGTSASKTVSILLHLIALAQTDKTPTLTSVVSESFPHLRKGAMRDFLMILEAHGYFVPARWSKTDYTYTFETGSKIEFFSADQPGKVRGPRRDRLFINEANNVSFEAFDQLEVRTKDCIFLDWNPVQEFWYHTELEGKRTDTDFLILTYKDNEALHPNIVASIEQRKQNKNWWKVYGEGLLGEAEARIYTGWRIIDEIPAEARFIRYGLNFGYSLHPAAACAIYAHNGGFIVDEILYGLGFKNRQIADVFKNQPQGLICADSAEPKSIDDLKEHGLTVLGVSKGKDSVRHGILYVQDQPIAITKRSVNIIKEYRNYMWMTDRQGKIVLEPDEPFHYSMDAVRYGVVGVMPTDPVDEIRRQREIQNTRQERQHLTADAGL